MKSIISGRLLWTFVVCLLPFVAHAGATLDGIRARGVLRVAVKNEGSLNRAEHNDPAHFQKRGFELELAHAIAREILGEGAKVELKTFRRRGRLPAVEDGTVDMAIAMFSINFDDAQEVAFSTPYYEGGLAVVQVGKCTVTRLQDLNGMTVSALDEKMTDPGGRLQKLASAQGAKISVRRYDSFDGAVAALRAGKVNALVSESANLEIYIAEGHQDLKRSPLLSHESFAVALPKGDVELLNAVNAVITNLRQSGELAAMLKKWKLPSP